MLKLGIRFFILHQAAIHQSCAAPPTVSVTSKLSTNTGGMLTKRLPLLFSFPKYTSPGCLGSHRESLSTRSKKLFILSSTLSSDSSDGSPEKLKKADQLVNSTMSRSPSSTVGALAWQRPGQPLSKEGSGQRQRRSFRPINRDPASESQGTVRSAVAEGMKVTVIKKENQRTGVVTEGIVMRLLTKSSFHPRGIKVCGHIFG
jgi:uncharacterized repeat protein (TIGR03833 family)